MTALYLAAAFGLVGTITIVLGIYEALQKASEGSSQGEI